MALERYLHRLMLLLVQWKRRHYLPTSVAIRIVGKPLLQQQQKSISE